MHNKCFLSYCYYHWQGREMPKVIQLKGDIYMTHLQVFWAYPSDSPPVAESSESSGGYLYRSAFKLDQKHKV